MKVTTESWHRSSYLYLFCFYTAWVGFLHATIFFYPLRRNGSYCVTKTVWRLERLGKSLSHLVAIVNDLEKRGIGFESLSERIDTSSLSGKLIFYVFASMAEFERNLIRERTHAGLASARARGRKGGRKPALSDDQVKQIKALLKDPAIKVMDIAKQYGVGRTTIFNAVGPVKPERTQATA